SQLQGRSHEILFIQQSRHSTEVKGVCSELTLQHIKKYIKVKIQEKNTLLFLIFCKVRSKGSLTSKISLVVGLFVA
ncbi:hypothetical protein ACNF4G_25715, partial [Klebsiella pneumoniae]